MINHSQPLSLVSTESALLGRLAVALFEFAKFRKLFCCCRVGRPEAWRVVPFEGSNPSSAPFFSGVEGGMFAGLISPRSPVRVRPPLPFFTLPPRFGRESLCWDGQRDFFIFSPLALSH
jgi:hypothetical protein